MQSVGRMDDWVCSQWGGWMMGYAVSGEGINIPVVRNKCTS